MRRQWRLILRLSSEALVLLIALTPSSQELQKLVAFENAFDLIFSLIEAEGSLRHGSGVVEDCLSLLANLLRFNVSNQSYFREIGCIARLAKLLAQSLREDNPDEPVPQWALAHRDKNLWGILAIVQLFLIRGGMSTPMNQTAFWQSGVLEQVLYIAFSQAFNIRVRSKAFATCADLIRGNSSLQERFGDFEISWGAEPVSDEGANGATRTSVVERINVIEALLKLTLQPSPIPMLNVRLAACECMKAFFAKHAGIRAHVLRRAIEGHASGQDQIPNILSVLLAPPEARGNADPYQTWMAAILMFHLLFENPETKAIAMQVTEGDAERGEEVITCAQGIIGNLVTGLQRGDDERISIGYLMLLCGWLFEDPDVVNDLLGEGSSIQSLIQEIKHRAASGALLPGLCAVLLGIIYEFSTKDSPIPRETLHKLLVEKLGREQYIDKVTKLRECHLVRDFEVLPQTAAATIDGGLPDIFFDRTFIEFLKDNFSRLIRAIDRDPAFEVSIVTNGIQKGISRELVDSLRAEIDEKNQTLQKLEFDLVTLQRKLEQEQLDHRKSRDSASVELSRIQQINQSLQKSHEQEIAKLKEQHKQSRDELLKQHGDQLRTMDSQLKQASADYERKSARVKEQHDTDVAALKHTITSMEAEMRRFQERHTAEVEDLNSINEQLESRMHDVRERYEAQLADLRKQNEELQAEVKRLEQKSEVDIQKIRHEYTQKLSQVETRAELAEESSRNSESQIEKLTRELRASQAALEKLRSESSEGEKALKALQSEIDKYKADAKEKEDARQAVQTELDDLLIVFADLEAKRSQDKVRYVPIEPCCS